MAKSKPTPSRKSKGTKALAPRSRPRKPKGDPGGTIIPTENDEIDIHVSSPDGVPVTDPLLASQPVEVEDEDGNIEITFPDTQVEKKDVKFNDNLAEHLDDTILGRISETLLEAIEEDERNRAEWIQQRADGLDLLGWKVERPGAGNIGTTSTAVPGQSTVRDGILGAACDRFQANAFSELCPAVGPCKILDYGTETNLSDNLANEFEKDMNFYLTGSGGPGTATEYYPDTREMLFWTGYASGMFKKVYKCPIRNRPVSERVDGADLIVPSNATDLDNAGRITHVISMRQSVMKRMQIIGNYRDVPLSAPTSHANVLATKIGDIVGMNPLPQREPDQDYTIYESYCELDIEGFEHKIKGKATGLPLPYKVSLDKDSRVILEIRRNWDETKPDNQPRDLIEGEPDDDNETELDEGEDLPVAKIPFVLFPYGTGLGIYGTGLLHRLGNYAMALTAMLRECIDAGMFASFPGFLYAKPLGRQLQTDFRVPPGGGAPIDVSATGNDITKAVLPLPYKDVSVAMVGLMGQTRETASAIGGTAEAPTGEGVINAPVGSVLAAIDQATRVEGGVHKALYDAQRKELGKIRDLFRDDPEALWRGNKRPAMGTDRQTRLAKWKMALENCDLVPAADPNVPSRMHRLAKATTLLQVAGQFPGALKVPDLLVEWGQMAQIDVQHLLAPPQGPPPPDQLAVGALQLKAQEVDLERQKLQQQAQQAAAALKSKETIAAAQLGQKHAASGPEPQQPQQVDPMAVAELQLKGKQVAQSGQKMILDYHSAKADRESRQNEKAMDLAARLATHQEAQPEVNSELQGLSQFLTPNSVENGPPSGSPAGPGTMSSPMSHGGMVQGSRHDEEERTARLAAAIAEYIKSQPSATTH